MSVQIENSFPTANTFWAPFHAWALMVCNRSVKLNRPENDITRSSEAVDSCHCTPYHLRAWLSTFTSSMFHLCCDYICTTCVPEYHRVLCAKTGGGLLPSALQCLQRLSALRIGSPGADNEGLGNRCGQKDGLTIQSKFCVGVSNLCSLQIARASSRLSLIWLPEKLPHQHSS